MLDPNMLNQLGKIRQQELLEIGQQTARQRWGKPRRTQNRRQLPLLLLLNRAFGR